MTSKKHPPKKLKPVRRFGWHGTTVIGTAYTQPGFVSSVTYYQLTAGFAPSGPLGLRKHTGLKEYLMSSPIILQFNPDALKSGILDLTVEARSDWLSDLRRWLLTFTEPFAWSMSEVPDLSSRGWYIGNIHKQELIASSITGVTAKHDHNWAMSI
jgi:hypothetical protein